MLWTSGSYHRPRSHGEGHRLSPWAGREGAELATRAQAERDRRRRRPGSRGGSPRSPLWAAYRVREGGARCLPPSGAPVQGRACRTEGWIRDGGGAGQEDRLFEMGRRRCDCNSVLTEGLDELEARGGHKP